jgi:molybdopterin-guanine dinucleotide biosynthesis protein A
MITETLIGSMVTSGSSREMNVYVLIGGASHRMGTPKQELLLGGCTFLERTLAAARPVFDQVIAVDRHDGVHAHPGFDAVIREAPRNEHAPLFGVVTALQHAAGPAFILALDYPLLTSAILRFLADRFARSSKPLLIPLWNGRMQMLCGGYRPDLLPRIDERIGQGQLDLGGLTLPEETEIVTEDELRARFAGEPLMNVNTPEELEAVRRIDESGR